MRRRPAASPSTATPSGASPPSPTAVSDEDRLATIRWGDKRPCDRKYLSTIERVPLERFYEARYETLVTEPEKQLRGLYDLLGEPVVGRLHRRSADLTSPARAGVHRSPAHPSPATWPSSVNSPYLAAAAGMPSAVANITAVLAPRVQLAVA